MNSILCFVLFFLAVANCNGSRIMKNFIILLEVNEIEIGDLDILANVIASPILKTMPRIISEDDILLNYSVKFPDDEDPIRIPLSEDYTLDYFQSFVGMHISEQYAMPILQLEFLLLNSPPFTDILMITNSEPVPEYFLSQILHLMNEKRINVVVRMLGKLPKFTENLYDSEFTDVGLSNEYRRINEQTEAMRSEMVFTKVLKRILLKDEDELTRNATITVVNGMAFYKHLRQWDFVLRVGEFLSEFNETQSFSFNDQTIRINNFSVLYSFENDYFLRIDLKAEYISGRYIDVLSNRGENHYVQKKMDVFTENFKKHYSLLDIEMYNKLWQEESAKIKFSLTSLITALIDSSPNSVIYVLTDVPPKNTDLIPVILKFMTWKNITVDISYYGENSDPKEYVQINEASITAL